MDEVLMSPPTLTYFNNIACLCNGRHGMERLGRSRRRSKSSSRARQPDSRQARPEMGCERLNLSAEAAGGR